MTGFADLFNTTRSALAGDGAQTIVRFNAASRGKDGLHRQVKIREFSVDVDEPPALGGKDRAPNPVEYAKAALATCQEITYRLHGDALGIPLKDVSVQLEGELDLRGLFGAGKVTQIRRRHSVTLAQARHAPNQTVSDRSQD